MLESMPCSVFTRHILPMLESDAHLCGVVRKWHASWTHTLRNLARTSRWCRAVVDVNRTVILYHRYIERHVALIVNHIRWQPPPTIRDDWFTIGRKRDGWQLRISPCNNDDELRITPRGRAIHWWLNHVGGRSSLGIVILLHDKAVASICGVLIHLLGGATSVFNRRCMMRVVLGEAMPSRTMRLTYVASVKGKPTFASHHIIPLHWSHPTGEPDRNAFEDVRLSRTPAHFTGFNLATNRFVVYNSGCVQAATIVHINDKREENTEATL